MTITMVVISTVMTMTTSCSSSGCSRTSMNVDRQERRTGLAGDEQVVISNDQLNEKGSDQYTVQGGLLTQ